MLPKLPPDELNRILAAAVDAEWYRARYPDIAAPDLDPVQHFVRFGAAENRDPNRFFDSAWYLEHYPDVAASGAQALQHYLLAGAPELRNPHPRFDARYYAAQHPDAAANPLLYHLRTGLLRGFLTEEPIDIRDYLPVRDPPPLPQGQAFVDVIIPLCDAHAAAARQCIRSVLADRTYRLARVTVIEDGLIEPDFSSWLAGLADEGLINLLRNRRRRGFAACVSQGIARAESHDVVLLQSDAVVSAGWLERLGAIAWSAPAIATVSPLADGATSPAARSPAFGQTPAAMDAICSSVNRGRSVPVPVASGSCLYIRRDAMRAIGPFADMDAQAAGFCLRATQAGWQHRLACDTFVTRASKNDAPAADDPAPSQPETPAAAGPADPFRFAVTAAVFQRSGLPVILMVSHDMGGGVRHHINSLANRCRGRAHVLLIAGTDRGTALSVPNQPDHPVLKLPSDRLDDLVLVLRSAGVSRVHLHHLLHMDTDIRRLIHRLGVTFDLTVHDYYALCPQVNLLRWPEGVYCGEPGPAECNACIADLSSHGARDILSWRHDRTWQFNEADRIICPSEDVRTRLARYGIGGNTIVVPHESTPPGDWPVRDHTSAGPPLRVVLLGALANQKGARTVASVAEAAEPGTIDIHLIGYLEDSVPEPAARLIKATGAYREGQLETLLRDARPDVFWFPSTAAETYSYTLGTAIATGLPIVATRLGSFPERLAGRPNTWLVHHHATTAEYLAVFAEVQATLTAGIAPRRVRRPAAQSDFYDRAYLAPIQAVRRQRKPRIVVLPERQDNGTPSPCAYIRLLQPLDHPSIGAEFEIVLADLTSVFDVEADIIATQRGTVPDAATADRLADHARRTGARLLFDLDDDLLSIPPTHPDAAQLRPQAKGVRRMLSVADTVWLSTPGLAERLRAIRPDAVVVENRLDERIWCYPPQHTAAWDSPVRIVCMGTSTHDRDFALIEPVLARLSVDYGELIAIDILGMTRARKLASGLRRIGPSRHAARSYPGFVNWLNRVQPRWHIGLAPLLDTRFNQSKSPIKAMDHAAMGLVTLASDVPAYRGSIADGPGGQLVANHPDAWHAALDWLIRDHALRRQISARAHAAFTTSATLQSAAEQRLAAWRSLLPQANIRLRGAAPALTILHDQSHAAPPARRYSGRG